MNLYQNKNIWIIGASFGIGEELFRAFDELGANLIVSARSFEALSQLISNKPQHSAIALDVACEQDFDAAIIKIKTKWQKIDLIIFCAGIYSPMNADNFDLVEAKKILEINFGGFVNFIGKILPEIKQKNVAHIAAISSVAGYFGMPNSMCYGASKAAFSNFVEGLYFDLKKFDTKVTLINPGFIKTRLTDKNNFKMPFIATPKQIAAHIIKRLPKNSFEIYFPLGFVFVMKILKILPFSWRKKIFNYQVKP
jgi:short-subunit dehydrogenase